VVLASRMALMDAEQARLDEEIAALTERINARRRRLASLEPTSTALTERGYELDREGQEAQNRANEAAVELERATARERANTERVATWKHALRRPRSLEVTRTQLGGIAEERAQQHAFLETAAGEARAFRQQVEARQQEARTAAEEVFTAERQLGDHAAPCHASADAGRQRAQPHGAGGREPGRPGARGGAAGSRDGPGPQRAENLGVESGQVRMRFESAGDALKRLESEIAALARVAAGSARGRECTARAANQLRGEQAAIAGRRDSLQALIRNHSYSTTRCGGC
jgi:chromosome segregation protein